jgi:hypothetical protein
VFKILDHAAANADHKVNKSPGKTLFEAKYAAG